MPGGWLLIGLTACQSALLPSAPPPQPSLSVAGPVAPGDLFTADLTGAEPGARVALLVGDAAGPGTCPPALGGACLGIVARGGVRAVASGVVDPLGAWSATVPVPRGAQIGVRQLQAVVQGAGAGLSAVTPLEIAWSCTDALEPNDHEAEAAALPGLPWTAALCGVEDDWYTLELEPGASLQLDLQHDPTWGDLDAELLDTTGRVRAGSYRVDGRETLAHQNTTGAPEVLLVRTWPVWTRGSIVYSAEPSVTLRPACVDDPHEPDGDAGTASPWAGGGAGVICEGSPDWYAIDTRAGEWLRADVGTSGGLVVASFRDADGHLLGGGTGPQAELVATADGVVYLEVTLQADDELGQGADYTVALQVDHATVCGPDALDPSNTPEEAAVIGPGTWPDLRVCLGHDWYAIPRAGGGSLEVWVRHDPADGRLASQLFDPDGNLVAFVVLSGGVQLLYGASPTPGTWLVHLADYEDALVPTAGGISYELTVVEGP